MAGKSKRQEFTDHFIDIWREHRSLWDVKSKIYRDRSEKEKSFRVFKEKLDMDGLCISLFFSRSTFCKNNEAANSVGVCLHIKYKEYVDNYYQ